MKGALNVGWGRLGKAEQPKETIRMISVFPRDKLLGLFLFLSHSKH